MAADAVFGTNELLENILLHLPHKDLLVARTVSKQWKALTDSSIWLKRAMFLAPSAEGPLRLETEELALLSDDNNKAYILSHVPAQHSTSVKLLPIFRDIKSTGSPGGALWSEPYLYSTRVHNDYTETKFRRTFWMSVSQELLSTMDDTSLWPQMFVTQPPCTALCVFGVTGRGTGKPLAMLRDKGGITLGTVADVCKSLLAQCNSEDVAEAEAGRTSCLLGFRTE